jgi:hypothetical protein
MGPVQSSRVDRMQIKSRKNRVKRKDGSKGWPGIKEKMGRKGKWDDRGLLKSTANVVDDVRIWDEENRTLGTEAKFRAEWRPIAVWLMGSERG